MAENRRKHFSCSGLAIPTDRVSVELKRQLNVAVAKQRLYRFRVGSGADQKRCEAVAQIMKAESSRVIIDQAASEVPVRRKNACLHRSGPQMVLDEHVGNSWLFAF